jgi:acetyl esterase/lipase
MRLLPGVLTLAAAIPAFAAADYQIEANIHYDRQHAETVLDILQPRAPALKNRPGVLVIHGGGWIRGNKESMVDAFCAPFVEKGWVVANVEYRLASAAPAPAAVNDVLKAARWFQDHAADYRVDPKQILVVGTSAGGHLALMVGLAAEAADLGPATKVAAVIDFYGIADVADQVEGPNQRDYAAAWIPAGPDRMELAKKLSPIAYVRKNAPPVLAIHGDADTLVPLEQSARLVDALKKAGADATLVTVPRGKHGFDPSDMQRLWPEIFKWLKKRKIV